MNFKYLFISLFSLLCFELSAQDVNVDVKKTEVYINDALFLNADGCKFKFFTCPLRTPEGNAVFTISTDSYAYYNNAAKAYKDRTYIIVRFLDFDLEMNSERTFKKLFEMMYKEGLIKDGTITEEDAKKFAKMYHDEVPGGVELIIR